MIVGLRVKNISLWPVWRSAVRTAHSLGGMNVLAGAKSALEVRCGTALT